MHTKVNRRWVQSSVDYYRIESRICTGIHRMTPEKELKIETDFCPSFRVPTWLLTKGVMDEIDMCS